MAVQHQLRIDQNVREKRTGVPVSPMRHLLLNSWNAMVVLLFGFLSLFGEI